MSARSARRRSPPRRVLRICDRSEWRSDDVILTMNIRLIRTGRSNDARPSRRASPPYPTLETVGSLTAREDALLGSHIVTARRGYLHHGIYVGAGRVVHYAGLAHGLHRGPVEETSLRTFARGRTVRVKSGALASFDRREVIDRARSRIGENCYRLLTNNCEHFCEWCLHGEHRSYQVEAWLARPTRAVRRMVRLSLSWIRRAPAVLNPRSRTDVEVGRSCDPISY
jgi:Lecithin retinol acyltransferase